MGAEKTFYQRLFRVPVAPVGTSINEQDDSWLRSSEDPTRSKDRDSDGYTHPYDQERKAKAKGKSPDRAASSQPKKSMWQRMKEEEEERKSRGPSPISNADASLISGHSGEQALLDCFCLGGKLQGRVDGWGFWAGGEAN